MYNPEKQDCMWLADLRRNEYDHLEATYAGLASVRLNRAVNRLGQAESELAKRKLSEREEKLDEQAREHAKTNTHHPS